MVTPARADDVPPGLLERLLDGPILRADAIAAGRRLAAGTPLPPERIAAAVVEEGAPLVRSS